MPFAQINCYNHTDPTNHTTGSKDLPGLCNEFWDTNKKDRIIATSPTKGKDLKPTKNTKYGRSELREVDPRTGKGAAVRIDQFGGNIIAVRQCIFDLGPQGKAIGLQWHGSSTRPLVKGQWYHDKKDDTFYLNVQLAKTFKAKEHEFILVKGVKRGEIYDLAFGFNKNNFIAAYNWKTQNPVVEVVTINEDGSYSKDTGLYSKMGVYCQTDITCSYEEMREGQGQFALLEWSLYHGDVLDIDIINMDETAFWRVGETLTLDAPERTSLPSLEQPEPTPPTPPVEEPAKPQEPSKPVEEPQQEGLYTDVPEDQRPALEKLVEQIQGNMAKGAKKTAKTNLSKLEDRLDVLDDKEGQQLRVWCNEQRLALK
jgi:hypothetical protein